MSKPALDELSPSSDLNSNTKSTTLRLAIISTPRCGNTWLRNLLSSVYGIPSFCEHNPVDFGWDDLPDSCVLQIHWRPVDSFIRRLKESGFHLLVMNRHPLDVLISILQFSLHDHTGRWLEGEEGNERSIYGAMPRSSAFLDYAMSKRAEALLSVSLEWWNWPGCTQVLYEVLNRDPQGELQRIVEECGGTPCLSFDQGVADQTINKLRTRTQRDHHFWIGQPGLWRSLLTSAEVNRLAEVLQPHFADFDYDWDADPQLTPSQADANWIKLVWADMANDLHEVRTTKRDLKNVKEWLNQEKQRREEAENLATNLERERLKLEYANRSVRGDLAAAREIHEQTKAQLAPYLELGPLALSMAFRFRKLSVRYPRLASLTKFILGKR
jgi:hypothetical protein